MSKGFLSKMRATKAGASVFGSLGSRALESRFVGTSTFASGAHVVSPDYYRPDPDFGTGYEVSLPGGEPGRCNPVAAPPGCAGALLPE